MGRDDLGEAVNYGIDFDDQLEYDYLQHLKDMGRSPHAVWVAAPTKATKNKSFDLIPEEALPSEREIDRELLDQDALREGTLDLDPRVREIMEALDDEAYQVDGLGDDYFGTLVDPDGECLDEFDEEEDEDDQYYGSDDASLEANHHADHALGHPGVRRVRFEAEEELMSSFSMSSSSLYRNDGLTLLDDRFDQVMQEYDEDEIGELEPEDVDVRGAQSVQNYDHIFDEFLATKKEVLGRRLVERGASGFNEVDELRESLRDTLIIHEEPEDEDEQLEPIIMPTLGKHHLAEDRWDCESILDTYSNTENHPHIIDDGSRARRLARIQASLESTSKEPIKPIALSHKTGLPLGILKPLSRSSPITDEPAAENLGRARSKNETAEEKRARKASLKDEKRSRRVEKKMNQQAFKQEQKKQQQQHVHATAMA